MFDKFYWVFDKFVVCDFLWWLEFIVFDEVYIYWGGFGLEVVGMLWCFFDFVCVLGVNLQVVLFIVIIGNFVEFVCEFVGVEVEQVGELGVVWYGKCYYFVDYWGQFCCFWDSVVSVSIYYDFKVFVFFWGCLWVVWLYFIYCLQLCYVLYVYFYMVGMSDCEGCFSEFC